MKISQKGLYALQALMMLARHYHQGAIRIRDIAYEEELPEKFSFEKDYLEKYFPERRMYAVIQDEYFIDIGIPEDYERAQTELKA